MSICGGVAGRRGYNPRGIFIHNGADSQNATTEFYRRWLQTHPLENGFAHYYVCDDGILHAEDDANCAWHCGDTDGIIWELKSARVWGIWKHLKRMRKMR